MRTMRQLSFNRRLTQVHSSGVDSMEQLPSRESPQSVLLYAVSDRAGTAGYDTKWSIRALDLVSSGDLCAASHAYHGVQMFLSAFVTLSYVATLGAGHYESHSQRRDVVPRYEPRACEPPVSPNDRIECGLLIVWENRARGSGALIRLPVTIYRSRAATPRQDPILYMTGGPGGTSSRVPTKALPYLDSRDYIVLEQRGTRTTTPALNCPEVGELRDRMSHGLLEMPEAESQWIGAARRCTDRLRSLGIDLASYTTRSIADDVEDLRVALKISQWNLYGASYSTRIMLTAMRDHPAGIRSVVLDSPLPPESRFDETSASSILRALNIAIDTCAVVPSCALAHPNMREGIGASIARFTREPRWLKITDSTANQQDSILLTGALLGREFGSIMNGVGTARAAGILIDGADRGNLAAWVPMIAEDVGSPFTLGMRMVVWCSDVVPFEDRAQIAAQRDTRLGLGGADFSTVPPAVCDAAGLSSSQPIEGVAVKSDIPTLVLSGQLDPNTPTPWARGLLPNLSRAFVVEFPGLSHVPGFTPCGSSIINRFFNEPTLPPTDSCIARSAGLVVR